VFVYILKRKHSLPSPSMVHSDHSLYVVFVDPLWGIYDWCLKNILLLWKLIWSWRYFKDMSYLPCIYYLVKAGIRGGECHTLRSRCACVWKYLVANLIVLCSMKQVSLLWDNEKLYSGTEIMSYHFDFAFFFFFLFFFFNTCTLVHSLFFYIASCLCLSYNKFWEINHHLEAFIWSPNNLFGLLPE
jgi:hypothetical protein